MPRARETAHNERAAGGIPLVVLVDDHPLWRETLKKVIERSGIGRVVAEASDGDEAVEIVATTRPDLVVMDMALPTVSGVEATRQIRATMPATKVLVISSFEERSSVLDAVRAGASGYLLKTSGAKEVADAVARVADGELVFPPKLADVVLAEFRRLAGEEPGSLPCRVAIAGDSAVYREGLARVLADEGFVVAGSAETLEGLRSMLEGEPVDVAILDFHAAADMGVRAASRVRATHPDLPMLVLSQSAETSPAYELISSWGEGVGYLLRDRVSNVEELGDAIKRVAAGGSVVDPAVIGRLVESPGERLTALTQREREVLGLMAEGHSNQAICERLFLSAKTLEKHVRAIFSKLGLEEASEVHRRVLAVLTYLRSA